MPSLTAKIILFLFHIPIHTRVLTNVNSTEEKLQPNEEVMVSSSQYSDRGSNWSVTKQTLSGGVQEGVELIQVDNGRLKFTVIPTRGMSIYRAECGNVTLGWNSPVKKIVHPRHVDLNDHGGLGWLAGFNEWMVRCGVAFAGHPGEDGGKMLTLHGRVGNIPADQVTVQVDETAPHRIRICGLVEEKMFKFGVFELWTEVSTVPGSNWIQISDRLVNKSEYEQEYQIIYHTNFGRPILQKGAQFYAPLKTLAPFDEYAAKDLDSYQTYLGPTRHYGEQVYCATLHADDQNMTTVMLQNAVGDNGVAMQFAVDTLPYFTLWKNTDTETDGYVTGLEPGTGYPYNRCVERVEGRVPKLAAGADVRFQVELTVLENAQAIQSIGQQIDTMRAGRAPIVSKTPPKSD